jgi:predicted ATPase/DNA-binding CsgD family transcriptional regulator/DNA-binding XRE family transcriptional regulator
VEGTEPSSFGGWLRRRRELAGLTQEELAARAGLTAAGVASIERGRRQRPYPHTIRAIATALELAEDERTELLIMIAEGASGAPPSEPGTIPITPAPPTLLIGRDQALADVRTLLQDPLVRLITLTGPGGVGKTSLALEVAQHAGEVFPDNGVFVPLESLDDPGSLLSWIAGRIGIIGTPQGSEVAALQRYFEHRRALLILDNFEHLLPAAREVADLLRVTPELTVLVTSRAPLRLRGEREYPVGPLAVPDLSRIPTPEEIRLSGAVQLFVERARASNPSFVLSQENATAVTAICRRLDGLPLALELAAARLRVLSPTELLARLDQSLPLLTGGPRDLPERQRTIRQTIDWSYRILGPAEQDLFRRLSIFVGGWDAAAAEAIGSGVPSLEGQSLDLLSGLVEHSLVLAETQPSGSTRYRMLETIREFGRDQLLTSGETGMVARAHAQWCLRLAEQAATHFYGPHEADWLDRLEQEHPNLRAAVVYATEHADHPLLLRLVAPLGRLWNKREHFGEGEAWMAHTLRVAREAAPSADAAAVLFNVGRLVWDQGNTDTGLLLLMESLAAWRALDDVRGVCTSAIILANMLRLRGQTADADSLLREARFRLEELGNEPFWLSTDLRLLGIMALERRDWAAADALLEQALEQARASKYPWGIASALHNLAHLQHLRGNHQRSLELFLENLQISLNERDYWPIAVTLPPVAEVLVALGETGQAVRLFGAASSLAEQMVTRLSARIPVVESQEQARAVAREAVGEADFALLWQAGRLLTPEQAVAELLQTAERRRETAEAVPAAESFPDGLSPREVEVIRLIAAGLTNAEAAERLYLSRRTVDAHLRRIYDKLDLASRTELVRFAHDHRLA